MKIFLDFDDTLFNTGAFIRASQSLFVDSGISEEMYKEAWFKVRELRGLESMSYDFETHMKMLHEKKDFDDKELRKKVEDFYREHTKEYVFPDVEEFLEKMQKRENTLYLISFKTGDFQDKKIMASGLMRFFDDMAVGSEEKGELLKRFFNAGDEEIGCFVDDRAYQIENVKRAFPKITTLYMQRAEGRYHEDVNEFCDYTVRDLAGVENILRNQYFLMHNS